MEDLPFLTRTPVSSLLPPAGAVITLNATDSISDALKVLNFHNILSAPVLNREANMCIGSVDVLDLAAYVLAVPSSSPPDYTNIAQRLRAPVSLAIDASMVNTFLPIPDSTPLSEVISRYFASGVHRVPIVNSSVQLCGVLAQMDVASYILQHQGHASIAGLLKKTISELDIVPRKVICVKSNMRVIDTFNVIVANSVSAVAVVTDEGLLSGCISASDFKDLSETNLREIGEAIVGRFLEQQSPICCSRTATLAEVLGMLVSFGVHRVFVIDDIGKPIGLVALTDVMRALSNSLGLNRY